LSATHDLKCGPEYFQAVKEGKKPFEVRNNDRDFHVGDYINLREYDRVKQCYTGEVVLKIRITYVLKDYPALLDGFVVLGLELPKNYTLPSKEDLEDLENLHRYEAYFSNRNESPITDTITAILSSLG
jgi:ASC-1-like (ASCH) protein